MIGIITWLRLGAVCVAVAGLAWIAAALVDHGRLREREAARAAVERQARDADAAERRVLECPLEKWNRQLSKCEKEATQ